MVFINFNNITIIGQSRPGADEPTFALIFSLRSFPHLLALEEVYQVNYVTPLRFVVEDEFSGGFRDALLAHRKCYSSYNSTLLQYVNIIDYVCS